MTTVGSNIRPETTEGKIIAVIVSLIGIGTATLVIGAVAQRFLAHTVEHVESTEEGLLAQVQEISTRFSRLERALRERSQEATDEQTQRGLGAAMDRTHIT